MMPKGTLQIAYDKLLLENLGLKEDYTDLKEIQTENYNHAVRNAERIEEIERIRAGVRVSLIAMRTAVKKGGSVSEEQLKDLIDELEAK